MRSPEALATSANREVYRRRLPRIASVNWDVLHGAGGIREVMRRAALDGLWISVYVVRPWLREDWSPAWAPHAGPALLRVRERDGALYARDAGVRIWPRDRRRDIVSGYEALLSLRPLGPVLAAIPLASPGHRLRSVRGAFSVEWDRHDPVMGLGDHLLWLQWRELSLA